MLVITRKKNESLLIGDDIEINIVKVEDGSVKLAISAPKDITILRKEVFERVKEENKKAISGNLDILKEFNELRGISTEYEAIMKKTSYLKVKKWFLTTFPEIDEYKQERKETWEVIDRKAKELKEQKAKNENNENNKNENTALNVPAVMINTAHTTTILS